MNELAERRRLLLMEADLHRTVISLECASLRTRLAGVRAITAGGPMMVAGGAVAGLLAVRHWRKLVRWVPAALTAMRWMKSIKGR